MTILKKKIQGLIVLQGISFFSRTSPVHFDHDCGGCLPHMERYIDAT